MSTACVSSCVCDTTATPVISLIPEHASSPGNGPSTGPAFNKLADLMDKSEMDRVIEEYLNRSSWKGAENANSTFSHQGLMQHLSTHAISQYWLKHVYTPEVRRYYEENRFHIHDLGFLSAYCSGWSIEDILTQGFGGVENKIQCRPASHLNTALNQIVNFLFTLQGELAGAQAVSNLDTFLAPFVRVDRLSFVEVFKYVQSFVYSLNVPTRSGFQAPFTNVSMDLVCPKAMRDRPVIISGRPHAEWTYGDFQEEMDMINRAFTATMVQGDGNGTIFSFPIPTYNLSKDFDWDDERYKPIWEMTAKYGVPYFANFINSDLNPEDFRSMCCRLRLDVRKLHTRGGGLFGSAPLTGSIGVVTLNLPNIARRAGSEKAFFVELKETLRVAKDSLEIKRKVVESRAALYPYATHYLQSIKERTGSYWKNHFSTIGINGMNEACLELFGEGIAKRKQWSLSVLDFIKAELQVFQTETTNFYNLEATPAESTSYKLAQRDRELFPNSNVPEFYSNSTLLPVDATDDLFEALDHQEELQCSYTGGTVFHAFLGERLPSWVQARDLVKMVTTKYRIPYLSLTPTFSICKTHGYISGEHETCNQCGRECLVYSRIVGYYRPTKDWNKGKKAEYKLRKYYKNIGGAEHPINQLPGVILGGFNKQTLSDYPGKIASIVFTNGCNLSCSWCHNGDLARGRSEEISLEDVLAYMTSSKHKNLVISGGEPTIQPGLVQFLRILKDNGISVKLDTNGTLPRVLEQILSEKLVDYVAMDVKCAPGKYSEVTGGKEVDGRVIEESIELIRKSGVAHQFRTTVVPGLVDLEDLTQCKKLAGDGLVLQKFRSGKSLLDPMFREHQEQTEKEFDELCSKVAAL